MSALIYKDIVELKKTLGFTLLIALLIGVFGWINHQPLMLCMLWMFLSLILIGITFNLDAQSRINQYVCAAPIRRKEIVGRFYLYLWGMAAVGALVAFAEWLRFRNQFLQIPWFLIVAGMLFLLTFFMALQMPLMIRRGADHARLLFALIYFVMFAVGTAMGDTILPGVARLMNRISAEAFSAFLMALTLIFNFGSYRLSVRFMERKEF